MTVLAVGLSGVDFVHTSVPLAPNPDPPSQILGPRHRFKMLWIDAVAEPTQVVKVKALWDRADKRLIRKTVGLHHFSRNAEPAIARRAD